MNQAKDLTQTDSLDTVRSARVEMDRAGGASLDVLRFLAAGFILLFHYGSSAPRDLATIFPVFQQGWLATDFFLLLSGYILSRAYGERLVASKMRRTQFFLKRFARLWPSHIVVLLTFGAFVLASTALGFAPQHGDKYGAWAFFAQAFMVHGWGMLHEPGWNVPTWTISALLVCYALFSFYVPWVYKRSLPVMAGLTAVVLLTAHGIALLLVNHPFVDLPFAWGLLRAIPLFVIGNLIERMTVGLRVTKANYALSLVGVFAGISLLSMLMRDALIDTAILALLGVVLAVSGAVTFRETVVTQRMGRASFALFLTHSLVGAVWFGVSPKLIAHYGLSLSAQWGLWGLGVGVAIIVAFVFDACVDKPLSSWVQKRSFLKGCV